MFGETPAVSNGNGKSPALLTLKISAKVQGEAPGLLPPASKHGLLGDVVQVHHAKHLISGVLQKYNWLARTGVVICCCCALLFLVI